MKVKKKETIEKEVAMKRCPDCPLKAGLLDDDHLCPTCGGTGKVEE